jgi:DNA (cytosine-5)-methyltransferase 1
MKMIDLFAGIGGFSLAGHAAGFTTEAFVEKDAWCRRQIRKNFPGVYIHDDIYTFDAKPYEKTIDLISGGFPCQPFSVAGKRQGSNDDRFLWPEMLRVIRECKPTWAIVENVAGLTTMGEQTRPAILGDDQLAEWVENSILSQIRQDFEAAGYSVQGFLIPAAGAGAPHIRERLWLVGHYDHPRGSRRPKEVQEKGRGERPQKRHYLQEPGYANTLPDSDSYSPKDKRHNSERFQRFFAGDHWAEEWISVATRFCRVAHGLPARVDRHRRKRLKALGNAIVPHVAYEIMKAIVEIENQKS